MNQVPMIAPVAPYAMPAYATQPQQPSYNAVKIDIHNPSVNAPCSQPQYPSYPAPVQDASVNNAGGIYAYPQAPVYTYPQAQVPYQYPYPMPQQPQVMPMPQAYPAQPTVVQQPVPAQPQAQAPQQPQPQVQVPEGCPPCPNVPPVIVAPAPQAVNQQNVNIPPQVVTSPVEVKHAPEIVEPEEIKPQVDLNGFIAKLSNNDFDVQAAAMDDIAAIVKDNSQLATELVDTKVYDQLANILNFDSSALEGPSKEQIAAREKISSGAKDVSAEETALANTFSPREKAERNKCYSLYTTALLNKLYVDEVKKLSGNTIPLTELPNANLMVDHLKDNPDPMVRASAIEALSYLQNAENKEDLNTVFSIAQNDVDQGVSENAKIALEKLAQV